MILDTGSTDLWVASQGRTVTLTNNTDLETSLVYGIGQVAGNIAFAELRLGEYVIPSQAFINATDVRFSFLHHALDECANLFLGYRHASWGARDPRHGV